MKKYSILFLLFFVCTMSNSGFSQQRIRLNDGSVLKDIRLHEIRDRYIIYEKRQSLHNLEKYLIYWVETDTAYIKFRPDGSKCIMRKTMPRDEDFECSTDGQKLLTPAEGRKPDAIEEGGWKRWEMM